MVDKAHPPVNDAERRIKGYWDEMIERGLKARRPFDKGMERIRRHYLGDFTDQYLEAGGSEDAEPGTPQDTATISMVFSTNRTVTPYLYFKNPTIRAKSVRMPELATCIETFGEYLHNEQPYKDVTKRTVRFADLYGMGCIASEWDRVRGLPTRRRVRMSNIIVNPDATDDMRSVRWIGERFMEPIRKTKANKALRKREFIRPSHEIGQHERTTAHREKEVSELTDLAAGWKIWIRGETPGLVYAKDPKDEKAAPIIRIDEVKNRLIKIYDGSPYIHQDSGWPYTFDHDQFSHTFLRTNVQEGSFWGFSKYYVTKGLQAFLNWAWTFTLRRARKGCTDKILHDAGLADDVVERLSNGEDMSLIPVNREHLDAIERAVHVVKFDKVEPELLHLIDKCKIIYDEIVGITGHVRGGMPASGSRSATQAEIEDERAQSRINDNLDEVEAFSSTLVRKDIQIAAKLLPSLTMFRVKQDIGIGVDMTTGAPRIVDPETEPEAAQMVLQKGERIDESHPAAQILGPLGGLEVDQRSMSHFIGERWGRFWRDDLSVEQIRREIDIYIEQGTTRKLNKSQVIGERERQILNLVPVFSQLQMHGKVAKLINLYIDSFEDERTEGLKITDEELQALGVQLAQGMAENQAQLAGSQGGAPTANGQGQMARLLSEQMGMRG